MNATINILVVDDDRYLLDLLVETLKAIGYSAHGVASAEEALTVLTDTDFQLVISDIKMPGMSGVEFARHIKRSYPDLPVIFITGAFNSSVAHDTGVEGFISKPFRIAQVEELIKNLVGESADRLPRTETILVVDDDDTFRLMLMETLKLSGYSVVGAADSREAIDILEKGHIGTVIADYKMPGMDGISLTQTIKRTWPAMPVIIVTGYFPFEEEQTGLSRLVDGFLMKPFKIESITELLESLKKDRSRRKEF